MGMGVMEIAVELYRNPLLMEVMKLAIESDQQTLRNVTDYLHSKKEVEHEPSSKATDRAVS